MFTNYIDNNGNYIFVTAFTLDITSFGQDTHTTAFELPQPGAAHLTYWLTWNEPANAAACMTWHNKIFERLESYAGGRVYANYMSTPGGASAKSVFGSNFMRLKKIKKCITPTIFFI